MITIADTLTTDRIGLALAAPDHHAAIELVAKLLQNVPGVLNWHLLYDGLRSSCPCLTEGDGDFAICLPHARTDSVNAMVMSVGRFDRGFAFPDCVQPVRYIFCIGVPKALASDYLRIVGLLVRILREPAAEADLRTATTPDKFLARLTALETKL
jgi:mannitol/fructose-specific phosphotransferase system IIA component (Ntr-type)